jgi:hypothetical protein
LGEHQVVEWVVQQVNLMFLVKIKKINNEL